MSSYSRGQVQEATVPDAFPSNYGLEDFSHASAKTPKHLWDLTPTAVFFLPSKMILN